MGIPFLRAFRRNTSGSAAVEMALILPLLTVLVFTTFEGGYYMWNQHKVVKGVRDGARYAGRQSFADYPTCSTITSGVETNIKNLTRTGLTAPVAGTNLPAVRNWANADITVTASCAAGTTTGIYTNHTGGAQLVKVEAIVTYPSLFGALGFATSGMKLTASSQSPVMGL